MFFLSFAGGVALFNGGYIGTRIEAHATGLL
jgi:hypothetical protein